MEVTVLAHRKILLKGIEDLRKNKRVTKQLFAPTATVSQQVGDNCVRFLLKLVNKYMSCCAFLLG